MFILDTVGRTFTDIQTFNFFISINFFFFLEFACFFPSAAGIFIFTKFQDAAIVTMLSNLYRQPGMEINVNKSFEYISTSYLNREDKRLSFNLATAKCGSFRKTTLSCL